MKVASLDAWDRGGGWQNTCRYTAAQLAAAEPMQQGNAAAGLAAVYLLVDEVSA